MQSKQSATVYYNSACPVCRSGIDAQKGLMDSCDIAWIDVHQSPESAANLGIDLATIRERLHVVDEQGRLNVGADALSALWLKTPSLHWLGVFARWPLVRQASRLAYNIFARLLYRWNLWLKHW
jgi:predicted DCC family thiol-disulfide oxidoreductase YuxK